jgi:hypothetical protein
LEPREFYTVNSRVPGRGGRRGKRPSWRLTFHFAEVQGRIACVRLEIAADPGDPRPITASLLRRLPMTRLLADHRARAYEVMRNLIPMWDRLLTTKRRPKALRFFPDDWFAPATNGDGAHHADGRAVADTYVEALLTSQPPVKAIAARYGVSRATAAKLVAQARKDGYLGRTKRGVPGGLPYPVSAALRSIPLTVDIVR